jgi:hypothetical protein
MRRKMERPVSYNDLHFPLLDFAASMGVRETPSFVVIFISFLIITFVNFLLSSDKIISTFPCVTASNC